MEVVVVMVVVVVDGAAAQEGARGVARVPVRVPRLGSTAATGTAPVQLCLWR